MDDTSKKRPILQALSPNGAGTMTGTDIQFNATIGGGYGKLTISIASSDPAVLAVVDSLAIDTGDDPISSFGVDFIGTAGEIGGKVDVTMSIEGEKRSVSATVWTEAEHPQHITMLGFTRPLLIGTRSQAWVNVNELLSETRAITLRSSDSALASVPASITVPAGGNDLTVNYEVDCIGCGPVTISATLGEQTVEAQVELVPVPWALTGATPDYLNLKVGQTATVMLTFNHPTPRPITLSVYQGGDHNATDAPPTITVPPGRRNWPVKVKAINPASAVGLDFSYSSASLSVLVDVA